MDFMTEQIEQNKQQIEQLKRKNTELLKERNSYFESYMECFQKNQAFERTIQSLLINLNNSKNLKNKTDEEKNKINEEKFKKIETEVKQLRMVLQKKILQIKSLKKIISQQSEVNQKESGNRRERDEKINIMGYFFSKDDFYKTIFCESCFCENYLFSACPLLDNCFFAHPKDRELAKKIWLDYKTPLLSISNEKCSEDHSGISPTQSKFNFENSREESPNDAENIGNIDFYRDEDDEDLKNSIYNFL